MRFCALFSFQEGSAAWQRVNLLETWSLFQAIITPMSHWQCHYFWGAINMCCTHWIFLVVYKCYLLFVVVYRGVLSYFVSYCRKAIKQNLEEKAVEIKN